MKVAWWNLKFQKNLMTKIPISTLNFKLKHCDLLRWDKRYGHGRGPETMITEDAPPECWRRRFWWAVRFKATITESSHGCVDDVLPEKPLLLCWISLCFLRGELRNSHGFFAIDLHTPASPIVLLCMEESWSCVNHSPTIASSSSTW